MEEAVLRRLVVAIDGPSGSGKSTVARKVAVALGLRYLDTGSLYRAATLVSLRHHVDLSSSRHIVQCLAEASLDPSLDPERPGIAVAGEDVSGAIREADVTGAVSEVAALPEVRALLLEQQRALVGAGGIVVEGRDIGTTVCPDAAVKVFLTASATARAARRSAQEGEARVDVATTEAALARRDGIDSSRAASPLAVAEDAVVIDSTSLTADEVVDEIVGLVAAVAGAQR